MKITITGWKSGFDKIRFNALLRERLSLSLAEAKSVVDAILEVEPDQPDQPVVVNIPDSVDVASIADLLARSKVLGVVCHLSQ
jgi:hypothetical protein